MGFRERNGLGIRQGFNVKLGGGFDPDYQAVLDYATTEGDTLPPAGVQDAQNTLMISLKDGGVFSKLDHLSIWHDGTTGLSGFKSIDWVRLSKATLVSSPSFTVNGVQGNGSSSYVDLNYNPTTDAVNYSLNDHSYGAYNHNSTAGAGVLISAFGNNGVFCEISTDNPNTRYIVFDSSTLGRTPSVPSGQQDGHLENNRNNSSDFEIYKDGVILPKATVSSVSNPNVNFRLFARDNNSFYSDGIARYSFIGASLTLTERTAFINAMNTYFSAL